MKKTHKFYFQIQLQMYVNNCSKGFFVMYTTVDLVFVLVDIDQELLNEFLPKAKNFWEQAVLPEIVARRFTTSQTCIPTPNNDSVLLPCYCQKVIDNVDVIICSRAQCLRKVFHVRCVPLKRISAKWKCDQCKMLENKGKAKARRDAKRVEQSSANALAQTQDKENASPPTQSKSKSIKKRCTALSEKNT